MAENLILRVKRLISGSANAAVDKMEHAAAETVMREAIRELDRTIDDVRAELGNTVAVRHRTNRVRTLSATKIDELTDKAKIATSQQRDDLAEAAIARQIDLEQQIKTHDEALKDITEKQGELEGFVTALTTKKQDMERDLSVFLASRRDAATTPGGSTSSSTVNMAERRADNAQHAFDRAFGGGAAVPGMAKVDREAGIKLNELEAVVRANEIANRLAAIKDLKRAS
jgi:phage shock protein A